MLDNATIIKILELTRDFWQIEITKPSFHSLAMGKEIGHRIADKVDDQTTSIIAKNFDTKTQLKKNGTSMPRSMGDIWVRASNNQIYNPLNVKAGETDKHGQPNMVSLKKLLRTLLLRQIDSYYLLIVKMRLNDPVTVSVYLEDLLDYLDYVAFDSGPGQIMLKERQFYEAVDNGVVPTAMTMDDNIKRLLRLLEDADRRL